MQAGDSGEGAGAGKPHAAAGARLSPQCQERWGEGTAPAGSWVKAGQTQDPLVSPSYPAIYGLTEWVQVNFGTSALLSSFSLLLPFFFLLS